ncbi:MAG: YicC family protein [Candidatus Omnitrophica bacterium]|nr:YicC family protein [Candidatus Omnitrophota bacterium]MDD5436183.1 YicC family protein [Candidatus Omnitrophota bacterium]
MVRSMTGFGKGEARFKSGKVTVEIKTVNHKFFDATLKLPNGITAFEDKIKEILQKRVKRGKVNLNLSYDGVLLKAERMSIDRKSARNYYHELEGLKRYLGLKEDINIKDVITLPGVLNFASLEAGLAVFWPKIKTALDMAIGKLISDREKEGKALSKDLASRAGKIAAMLRVIKSRTHLNVEEYRRKFTDRVKDLTGGRDIDMGRLEMEVAIFAKNSDISEEITRLENHLSNFNKTISAGGEVGKKIDFIAQELHREINTIGSKASDFKISKNVIEIKGEIEKIREQAKNLE